MSEARTLTLDGQEYDLNSLSENAKAQIINLQACDQKIQQAQQDVALLSTARNAYLAALKAELNK